MEDKFPDLVLLAGGKSTRMGIPKGLVPINKQPWLVYQLHSLAKNGSQRVTLVLGDDEMKYKQKLTWLERAQENWIQKMGLKISVVINPAPRYGPFSSLICAWNFLKKENPPRVFLLPIDVPCPDEIVLSRLILAMKPEKKVCVPVYEKKGGHPVLLRADFLDELLRVPLNSPEARLDHQIRRLKKDQVVTVPVTDQKVRFNLNTLKDLRAFLTPPAPS